MPKLHLVLANKTYSSWSLRAWLAMAQFRLPFEETVVPLDLPQTKKLIAKHSGAGRLPVLHHGKITIWESLAILEYLAEAFPDRALWPRNKTARAMARAVSNEMHAGFLAIRNFLPMNLRRPHRPRPIGLTDEVKANVKRIETLWRECRKAHGRGGPYLFGQFSIADSMYAPVVTRFETYAVPVSRETGDYMKAVLTNKAFLDWKSDALKERWRVEADEVE